MGRKTYAALKINKWISYSLLWSFKSYLLNVPWPINVYRYTILLVSNLLSISSAVIASLLFISIIASFLGSNLYHHSILLPDSSSINYIKNINMRLAPSIITIWYYLSGEFELRWEGVCHHLLLSYNYPIIVLYCSVVSTHNFLHRGTSNKQSTTTIAIFLLACLLLHI